MMIVHVEKLSCLLSRLSNETLLVAIHGMLQHTA